VFKKDHELKLKIEVLGSAGAFDFGETSASFLLNYTQGDKNYNFLVDCGHNVLKKLKDKGYMTSQKSIDGVFITHLHFDHIADLEGLIYYNYFVLGKSTNIYVPDILKYEFESIFDEKFNKMNEYGKSVWVPMVYIHYLSITGSFDKIRFTIFDKDQDQWNFNTLSLETRLILANHGHYKACGFLFKILDNPKLILVSGDTKANFEILKIVKKLINTNEAEEIIIFHDYSNWDDPVRNVHCCETDFNLVYKDLFDNDKPYHSKLTWYKYHNNENVGKTVEI